MNENNFNIQLRVINPLKRARTTYSRLHITR